MAMFLKNTKLQKTLAISFCILAIMSLMVVGCFAASPEAITVAYTAETSESIIAGTKELTEGLLTTFTFGNIVKFLGVSISTAGLLALGWFGLRKIVSMIQTALKRGKVKI